MADDEAAGIWRPQEVDNRCKASCSLCIDVCPFCNQEVDEDDIARRLFGDDAGNRWYREAGFVRGCYVGHVAEGQYREKGASGGIATWLLCELLRRGFVDKVARVYPTGLPFPRFNFGVATTADEVILGAKSAYYPVEMSGVIREVLKGRERWAVIGLPCFVKGLRLAQARLPRLKERIRVVIGLACGQLKSRHFTDYMLARMGVEADKAVVVNYRVKTPPRPASDFAFEVREPGVVRRAQWSGNVYGKAWGDGRFRLSACTCCDDIFAELADVAVFDAWRPEYIRDPLGTSFVLTRSSFVDEVIQEASSAGRLSLEVEAPNRAIESQRGVVQFKRAELPARLQMMIEHGERPPRKRYASARGTRREMRRQFLLERLRRDSTAAFVEGGIREYERRTFLLGQRFRFERVISSVGRRVLALARRRAILKRSE